MSIGAAGIQVRPPPISTVLPLRIVILLGSLIELSLITNAYQDNVGGLWSG